MNPILERNCRCIAHFQIPQLRKRLAASVEPARERLDLHVHDAVRAHVAALRERLAAHVAAVGPLARVAALVRLEVAELGEALAAGGFFAELLRGGC